ncbi:MAG: WbqC family protein [Alphaproteobacteria bacterium]|nr:WbqC family protein [Alphaproteobacteria bacterium]
MILCAHQPVYLPSIHLFNKISLCDGLVLLGHSQFAKQSWHQRNQIRAGHGRILLTVPVSQHNKFGQSLKNALIASDHWKRKHLRSIREGYARRPYFDDYFPQIEWIIRQPQPNLAALNNALLVQFLQWFGLAPKIYYSEDYDIQAHKTAMLIQLCHLTGANSYVSNEGARAYLDEGMFKQNNIRHYWQDFSHPVYNQGRDFIPNLSAIDILFNLGPASGKVIRDCGRLVRSAL